jgi:hypothetical protein
MPSGALQRGQKSTGGIAAVAGKIIERRRCPRPVSALIATACQLCRVCVCAVMHIVQNARPTAHRRLARRKSEEITGDPAAERRARSIRPDQTRRGMM